MNHYSLLITCEHAGNVIPLEYAHLFEGAAEIMNTHRGWDPGAWSLAESLGAYYKSVPLPFFTTRLLVEPNRSLDHPELFSEFSASLSREKKTTLINALYIPYRNQVESTIRELPTPVVHLSIHTFTPVYNGQVRNVDVGLLFDPERTTEKKFCQRWREELIAIFPTWKIAYNEPYKGIDDGFTTYLRTKFSDAHYLGIELEWNQKWAAAAEASHAYAGIEKSLTFIQQAL